MKTTSQEARNTDILHFVGSEKSFWTFNREERNRAAIFFQALDFGDNAARLRGLPELLVG